MAFTQQITTSTADFFSKLDTFLTANGWSTHRNAGAGEFAAWKNPSGSIWITMGCQWDTSDPRHIGIYQWHGQAYDNGTPGLTGTVPYDQDDDSGVGQASTTASTLDNGRSVDFGSGGTGIEEFWCFEDTNYFHVVIRRDGDIYAHFGAGYLDKTNDWTGGEYAYGHRRDTAYSNGRGVLQGSSTILLDGGLSDDGVGGVTSAEDWCGTLHIEGMSEQTTEKWGSVLAARQGPADLGTARNGDSRIHILGGFRGGILPQSFGWFAGTRGRGLVPFVPIALGYYNRSNGDIAWPIGYMPDVRATSIRNFAAEEEIVVGSDAWVIFPAYQIGSDAAGKSRNLAAVYKKVS
jgi:hypothetical protein